MRIPSWFGLNLTLLVLAFGTVRAEAGQSPENLAASEMPSVVTVPPEAQASATFNTEAATQAYLAQIPVGARARSDSYFEGGYWLILWDFLVGAAIALLLLNLGWSAAIRNVAERVTRFKPVHTLVYWGGYLALTTVLGFPLTAYEGYFREHQYGLATQTFGPWLVDQLKAFGVALVLGAIIVPLLFGIARRLTRTWWLWASVAMIAFLAFVALIVPVFIVPVFNKVTRLEDPKITQPILSLARANGIPVDAVYQVDASKQSKRMSANVSGFVGTMRVTLNDNLLRRGSPQEIQSVMGHEMGHYVLNHVNKSLMFFFIVIVSGFAFLKWTLDWSLARWGRKWQIRDAGDVAVLPLVVLLGSVFLFVLTPMLNTFVRSQETEADMYGINASREPDGFAQAAIHLGEYRKMDPGPLEEWLFFDHPSGRNRIYAAMRWKAENLGIGAAQSAR